MCCLNFETNINIVIGSAVSRALDMSGTEWRKEEGEKKDQGGGMRPQNYPFWKPTQDPIRIINLMALGYG